MKLIIQIPCYNEEKTLPLTLKDIPRQIEGIDIIEILVINDHSSDNTVAAAKELGVNHILDMPYHRGLAEAFRRGIDKALALGADIIVNTDGDNQYNGRDIAKLVKPILEKKAEIVIGCRDIANIKHFSWSKKLLQKIGSSFVRRFSRTNIADTTSGFRAYSKDAALKLNVFSNYTYTIETIIQAGIKEIPIVSVQVSTNNKLRESRLITSVPVYISKSAITMLQLYLMYEPLKTFSILGVFFALPGILFILRFAYFYFTESRSGHMQSLIIAAILIIMGFGIILMGLLGNVISANRKLIEETLYRIKKQELKNDK